MSTISNILNNAASGVQTAQTALQVVSNNVSNVNTPGYVQTQVNQASLVAGAQGAGVTIADVQRITNQYLEAANYTATAASGSASAIASTSDQAQALFGDPSASGSLFSNLDSVFSAFSSLAANPTSSASSTAVATVSQFFNQASSISTSLQSLSAQTDQQITSDVSTVNGLLSQISQLNTVISQGSVAGNDVTGAQNQQSQLILQLSSLVNVKVNATTSGGVEVLASDGTSLVGKAGASKLAYNATGPTGTFTLTNQTGVAKPFNGPLSSGELGGLAQLRNVDLPALSSQLSALTAGAATQLNAVSNAYSAVPAPTTLTGQNTGLDLNTIASDFSGKTTIALVNPTTNALDHSVAIDFTAQTISVDGGAATSFDPSNFLSSLNSAMASTGASATYANGVLSLSSNSSDGVAIQDDATDPATDGGQGFSQFFGLNNLVSSTQITNYNTGLKATDSSGFPAGQTMTFQLTDASGNKLRTITVATPSDGTVAGLITALNSPTDGVGAYGSFSMSANGALSFTASSPGASLSVVSDNTANTATGASVSALFGLGASTQNTAAGTLAVRSDLASNPALLPTATLNLSAASGAAVLSPGDTSGSDALGQAGLSSLTFPAVSGVPATTTTLSNYAASISSAIANSSASADTAKTTATAVSSNATSALSSVEGVSIDQEMINLTTYQQAYNASARMIQAASDLFTTLLSMTGT